MKKTLLILMALLCIGGSAVFARNVENTAPVMGVDIMKKGTTFHVYYKGIRSSDVKISIFNEKGYRVFFEVIRKMDGFVRPYNFSDLAEGKYTFEINDGTTRQTKVVTHEVHLSEQSLAHLARVGSENKFLLTVSKKFPRVVSIRIYGEKSQLLYREQLHNITDFSRLYNLNHIDGKFSFFLAD